MTDHGRTRWDGQHPESNVPRVALVSPMRIYREGLAYALAQQTSVRVVGAAAGVEELATIAATDVDVVLFDLAVEGGLPALRLLYGYGGIKVVLLGLSDDESAIVTHARAGIAGYVTREASLGELTRRIHEAKDGEFSCSPRLAATLLRNLANPVAIFSDPRPGAARLTPREMEIVALIEREMSNKEIARQLTIQLATVKNHVHNILEKLAVQHRSDAVRAARSLVDDRPRLHSVNRLGGV